MRDVAEDMVDTTRITLVDVPESPLRRVPLEPRVTRGQDVPPPAGELLLGGPYWTSLPDREDEDAETAAFRRDPGWRWLLGVMSLSIHPAEDGDERFERAWLTVELTRPDAAEPAAVAWSMKPDRVASSVKRTTQVSLGPKLTIADVGIEAGVERGVERTLDDVSLEALNEKTSRPQWVLRRTPSAELRGCSRFALVVRAPQDAAVQARVDVGYVTARRQLVFLWPKITHETPFQVTTLP